MRTSRLLALCLVALSFALLGASPDAQRTNAQLPRTVGFDAPRAFELQGAFALSGDLNRDGLEDLIEFYRTTLPLGLRVKTWMNQGDLDFDLGRDFPVPAMSTIIGVGADVGDVTGDGLPDLVLSLAAGGPLGLDGFLVHPGLGDGSFGTEIVIDENPAFEIVLGDFDGDGRLEIAAEHQSSSGPNYLRWWKWNGTTFTPSPLLEITSGSVYDLYVGDVTGDGVDDLLTHSGAPGFGGASPTAWIGLYPSIEGAPTKGLEIPIGTSLDSFLVEDQNADGLIDVLTVRANSNNVTFQSVVQVTPGSFLAYPQLLASHPRSLPGGLGFGVLADIDLDGLPDFVGGSTTLGYMRNLGGGSFQYTADAATGERALLVTDIDGDRIDDLVMSESFLLGTGSFRDLFVPTYQGTGYPYYLAAAGHEDLDGDGDVDMWGYGGSKTTFLNDGRGSFAGVDSTLGSLSFGGGYVSHGDFDGDRDPDYLYNVYLAGAYYNTALIENDGHGVYAWQGVWMTGKNEIPIGSGYWPAVDLDGDGDLDVAAKDAWWERTGSMQKLAPFPTPYAGEPYEAADVDDDGDADLIVQDGSTLSLLRNDGAGVFTTELLRTGWVGDLAGFLDVDLDGDLDAFGLSDLSPRGTVELFENRSGGFVPGPVLEANAVAVVRPGVGDVDGDGEPELWIARDSGDSKVRAFTKLRGTLAYGGFRDWYAGGAVKAFFDVDSDGDLDFLSTFLVKGRRHEGRAAGRIRQHGAGEPGTGGFAPVLGMTGPVRLGSKVELRIRNGVGGARGQLLLGTTASGGIYPPTSSVPQLVGSVYQTIPFVLSGNPGEERAGTLDSAVPLGVGLIGAHIFHQAFLLDSGATEGFSSSNGLEVVIGRSRPAVGGLVTR